MKTTENRDLVIKLAKYGQGVFAKRKFSKDEAIFSIRGDLYAYADLPFPYNEVEDRYVQVGLNLFMGPTGDMDDLINHSCNPNAALVIPSANAGGGVIYIAIRDIHDGEEITWDYSTTMYDDDWEIDCSCESDNCRKRIREFRYLPPDIQQKYINLGIVPEYILKGMYIAISN